MDGDLKVQIIGEQGDLNCFNSELSDEDQKKYDKQKQEEDQKSETKT